ncbi:reverse transcriptase domain-containing protein [Tanacetum coccineum]
MKMTRLSDGQRAGSVTQTVRPLLGLKPTAKALEAELPELRLRCIAMMVAIAVRLSRRFVGEDSVAVTQTLIMIASTMHLLSFMGTTRSQSYRSIVIEKMAPKRTTRSTPVTPTPNATPTTTASQVKFATCTLQDDALTWWNAHVKTTTPEAAHAMPWAALKKMMTDKYCPRGEIQKTESLKVWNLEGQGTDGEGL